VPRRVDNPGFPNRDAHLRGRQACAPRPVPAVVATGTKVSRCAGLWTTPRLCQNYPQRYAPAGPFTKFHQKLLLALCRQALAAMNLIVLMDLGTSAARFCRDAARPVPRFPGLIAPAKGTDAALHQTPGPAGVHQKQARPGVQSKQSKQSKPGGAPVRLPGVLVVL
jgi:hypothetical protein